MSYLINKIEKEGLAEFLLNPYSKAACLEDTIFQKYTKDAFNDDVYMIKGTSFILYGRVNYDKKEIIERMPFTQKLLPPFVAVHKLKANLKAKMKADLEDMKVSRAAEIKSSTKYAHLEKTYKEGYLKMVTFQMLGATSLVDYLSDGVMLPISKFVDLLKLDDICDIKYGNLELVNQELEKILMSEEFLVSQILIKEVHEEAKNIIETGALSERQKHFKNMIDKTKYSGCVNFTVETEKGERLSCRNMILTDGSLFINGRSDEHIDFESIKKVITRGKAIYEKGVF